MLTYGFENDLRDHLKQEYDTQGIGVRFVRSLFPASPASSAPPPPPAIVEHARLAHIYIDALSFLPHIKEPQKHNGTVSCMGP
jgi:hypothetical protein